MYLVHFIKVSGDLYKNISFANKSSSNLSSLLSRTMYISKHNFNMRSTFGTSSNIIRYEIEVKKSRTNLPINQTKPTYRPIILKKISFKKKKKKKRLKQIIEISFSRKITYPLLAKKDRCNGGTKSLRTIISRLPVSNENIGLGLS